MYSVGVVLLAVSLIPATLPCAVDPQFQYGIVETMLETDFIIYGQYKGEDSVTGHGMFMVFCMLKANGADMPENITIQLDSSSCSPTEMSNGTDYIIMLKTFAIQDRDTFLLAEPSKDSSAAFPANSENLRLAANLCGLNGERIKTPEITTQTTKTCPKRTATTKENCVGEDPPTSRGVRVNGLESVLLFFTMMMMVVGVSVEL